MSFVAIPSFKFLSERNANLAESIHVGAKRKESAMIQNPSHAIKNVTLLVLIIVRTQSDVKRNISPVAVG